MLNAVRHNPSALPPAPSKDPIQSVGISSSTIRHMSFCILFFVSTWRVTTKTGPSEVPSHCSAWYDKLRSCHLALGNVGRETRNTKWSLMGTDTIPTPLTKYNCALCTTYRLGIARRLLYVPVNSLEPVSVTLWDVRRLASVASSMTHWAITEDAIRDSSSSTEPALLSFYLRLAKKHSQNICVILCSRP